MAWLQSFFLQGVVILIAFGAAVTARQLTRYGSDRLVDVRQAQPGAHTDQGLDLQTRSFSGHGYASQTCGAERFYCAQATGTSKCLPRSYRCPAGRLASTHMRCYMHECRRESPHRFAVYLVMAKIPLGWLLQIPALFRNKKARHEAVLYRGFLYEFGKSYPSGQELDVLDPAYKYRNGREGYRVVSRSGSSSCTRAQVLRMMRAWTSTHTYKLGKTDCQAFAKHLIQQLSRC
eukprot:scpid90426/ scgid22773/ 